ncbi:MAG: SDR family oxidoreductase [Bacteroidales bacterium]|nr:SDR family oxidoreductase [Bacteroidales bacterium]
MVILVTGVSRGIGEALALEFSAEGHQLLLVSRSHDRIHQLADECNRISGANNVHVLVYDINELDDLSKEFESLIGQKTDQIDALVNNAGFLVRKPFEKTTPSDVYQLFSTNLFAPGNLIRIALPFLRKSVRPHVVNITSMGGYQGSVKFRGLSYYSASKGALSILTECLAEEFKKDGIFFNSLALGAVQTEMFSEAFPGFRAPLSAKDMAGFIKWFTLNGHNYFNGKTLPVSVSTP